MRFLAALTQEGKWWVARCLDVEVTSQGQTIEEALANLKEALELYFEDSPSPTGPAPMIASLGVSLPTLENQP